MFESVYKKEISANLYLSINTLQRKLNAANLEVPRGLIYPLKQKKIYIVLGYADIWQEIQRKHLVKNR